MKRLVKVSSVFIILTGFFIFWMSSTALADEPPPSRQDILRGARLYDNWFAALDVAPPPGDMPIWSRQSTNTRSGPDTWRCSECHGWDYGGAGGAYASGSHTTGFPDVLRLSTDLQMRDIVAHLQGANDPGHDFSAYLDESSMLQLAAFLKYGAIDDALYIDPLSLQVIAADLERGRALYLSTCRRCHGEDGRSILFRSEGIDEYLGSLANRDPWRFLHRTRFGVAGTDMPIGYDLNWTAEDGRDVLAFAQSLPTGGEIAVSEDYQPVDSTQGEAPAGPADDVLSGILTGIAAFTGAVGYAVLFIGGFLLLGFLVVLLLGRRK
jgi:thiosulfate dehydrogenase